MFQDNLGEELSVVLGAVPEVSWSIEALTADAREAFLDTIRSRVNKPGSNISATLHATSVLYFMIIKDTLPNHPLYIESSVDLPFFDTISVEESPSRYHIHS
jgi:hypothetical protein